MVLYAVKNETGKNHPFLAFYATEKKENIL
jgi:hypothetical protein